MIWSSDCPSATSVADQLAQVAGELGVGFVDGFALADQAAHVAKQGPRPGLLGRIGQPVGRIGGRRAQQHRGDIASPARFSGRIGAHSAGCGSRPRPLLARPGTANRRRRSDSDRNPPSAMITGPRKISRTQGFQ